MWTIKDIMLFICSILVIIIISVKSAGANETKVSKEYIETVVGHVIRNIDDMDHKQVLSDDLNRIAHMYAIDILLTFQKHLPTILEGAIVDLRLQADTKYKCSIQGEYKNKECYDDNK